MKIRANNKENSLYQDALDIVSVNDTASLPFSEFYRSANYWQRKADTWINEAAGTWEHDDANYTDLPIATANLVDGQQNYELPSTARVIDMITVKDDDGDFYQLEVLDKSQMDEAPSEYYEDNGFPAEYDLLGRSIFLYPAPDSEDVTTTNGLKVYFKREMKEFSITDTSTEPGFDGNFHRVISYGAAYDYCMRNGMDDRKEDLEDELEALKKEIYNHYGKRATEMRARIRPDEEETI